MMGTEESWCGARAVFWIRPNAGAASCDQKIEMNDLSAAT